MWRAEWTLGVCASCVAVGALVASRPDAPVAVDLQVAVERVHASCLADTSGANAAYIPALAEADPASFGVVVVTVEGELYGAGDVDVPFAIMSAAKPFTAALLLDELGPVELAERIGVEPTGQPFNSILAIEQHEQRAVNPMVNAGAIAAVSLLAGTGVEDRWERILGTYSAFAGRELELMEGVLASVSSTNHRNRAIANLLRDYGRLGCDPAEALEVYNRQSCVAVTAEDLAWMGATLAAGGVHPRTGERAMRREHVDEVLALMCMAGLYDEAGAWAYTVGLPAKSGVGGGVVAVVPGRLAIAAFSPRLNTSGNSVRATAAVRQLAEELELSLFHP